MLLIVSGAIGQTLKDYNPQIEHVRSCGLTGTFYDGTKFKIVHRNYTHQVKRRFKFTEVVESYCTLKPEIKASLEERRVANSLGRGTETY